MRRLLILMLPILLFSCLKEESSAKKYLGVVNIVSFNMPDTAFLLQPFQIKIIAEAETSCWSNLYADFSIYQNAYEYSLAAYGWYTPSSGCASSKVSLDTTLTVTFDKKGLFYIYYAKTETDIIKDSILITNPVK